MVAPEACDAYRLEDEKLVVIVHPGTLLSDRAWMDHVASDLVPARAIFATDEREPWVNIGNAGDTNIIPDERDLGAVSRVLQARGVSQPGNACQSVAVWRTVLPDPLPGALIPSVIFTPDGLDDHFSTVSAGYVDDLVEQLRSPLAVMPFVGAGMSAPFGFPMWDAFLERVAAEFGLENEVSEFLAQGDYESAAEVLEQRDARVFTDRVVHAFRKRVDPDQLRASALAFLPYLTTGPVITTNFDPAIEDAFDAVAQPLIVIEGPREDRIVTAVHHNQRALLKLHGTYDDRTFRVFTKGEYRQGYEEGTVTLASLAWLTFTNRPLLFLGSSLQADRTVRVLATIHERLPGLKHYALLAGHYVRERQRDRERQLSKWGVSPIWFPPGEYGRIAEILRELVERSATRPLPPAPRQSGIRPTGTALPNLGPEMAPRHPETPAIVDQLLAGQLSCFLGAYAHLGGFPLGDEFYEDLAARFDCPDLAGDRSAVAAFVARRRGTATLWTEVRRRLAVTLPPSALICLLVSLPGFLRARGRAPLWLFTTNYDTVLEDALVSAQEPFHLMYYVLDEGRFAHTAPDGTSRMIERPDAIRELLPAATVVVKLNGGIAFAPGHAEQAVVAAGQFERVAASIPDGLPACMQTVLAERSVLFLGHGLNEPDVRRLIEEFARQAPSGWWAVRQPLNTPTRRGMTDHFSLQGLTTIEADLGEFTVGLREALAAS